MTDARTEFKRTIEKLAESEALSVERKAYRDRQMPALLAAGMTWTEMQELTGLSARGLLLAVDRGKAAQ